MLKLQIFIVSLAGMIIFVANYSVQLVNQNYMVAFFSPTLKAFFNHFRLTMQTIENFICIYLLNTKTKADKAGRVSSMFNTAFFAKVKRGDLKLIKRKPSNIKIMSSQSISEENVAVIEVESHEKHEIEEDNEYIASNSEKE